MNQLQENESAAVRIDRLFGRSSSKDAEHLLAPVSQMQLTLFDVHGGKHSNAACFIPPTVQDAHYWAVESCNECVSLLSGILKAQFNDLSGKELQDFLLAVVERVNKMRRTHLHNWYCMQVYSDLAQVIQDYGSPLVTADLLRRRGSPESS